MRVFVLVYVHAYIYVCVYRDRSAQCSSTLCAPYTALCEGCGQFIIEGLKTVAGTQRRCEHLSGGFLSDVE